MWNRIRGIIFLLQHWPLVWAPDLYNGIFAVMEVKDLDMQCTIFNPANKEIDLEFFTWKFSLVIRLPEDEIEQAIRKAVYV